MTNWGFIRGRGWKFRQRKKDLKNSRKEVDGYRRRRRSLGLGLGEWWRAGDVSCLTGCHLNGWVSFMPRRSCRRHIGRMKRGDLEIPCIRTETSSRCTDGTWNRNILLSAQLKVNEKRVLDKNRDCGNYSMNHAKNIKRRQRKRRRKIAHNQSALKSPGKFIHMNWLIWPFYWFVKWCGNHYDKKFNIFQWNINDNVQITCKQKSHEKKTDSRHEQNRQATNLKLHHWWDLIPCKMNFSLMGISFLMTSVIAFHSLIPRSPLELVVFLI